MEPSDDQYKAIETPRDVHRSVLVEAHGDADDEAHATSRSRPALGATPEKSSAKPVRFRGRLVIWPGLLLLAAILVLGVALMTTYGSNARDAMLTRRNTYQEALRRRRAIGGLRGDSGSGSDEQIVSSDGVVGNPSVYPKTECALPNYVSKQGKFFAEGPNGESVQMAIKGVNWFGMETSLAVPFGLWTNDQNGTTVYEVALFLAKHKINSIRLPLCVASILANTPPLKSVVNQNLNRALDVTSYFSTIDTLTKALAYRSVSVLLDIHTLTPTLNGGWPWSAGTPYTQADFLLAVDKLTEAFCSNAFWNIIGVDIKNEPHLSTWGDGSAVDFRLMAQIIGNRVLKGCPNWLVFVEGISSAQTLTIGRDTFSFFDWWGGGLEGAGDAPVQLEIPSKLVYTPHYYTPAVYPQLYFLASGTRAGNVITNYVELDDATLLSRVMATTNHMFGFLAGTQDAVLIPGEFGGLYAQDLHPKKTTQRVTDYMIEVLRQPGYAGGYVWAINPESAYQFNPSDTEVTATEGLLQSNWLDVNEPFLQAMKAMDSLPHVQPFPCFPIKK
ncbi:hypothetical protein SDRG_01215 [Saprolegnia diclina VS20]|uniref:Glycoside hydrolase family 5 domain-containing protein n=1 Tax=Saprolegnia diclina (strain VS20) TaxID=1156394 RepID=T0R4F2_SAPDV|nr:hypothetical protein SDRG_01215 [Saprolegnia diclina VS20]EQC41240.1 hypothetical protein SDRG_01215 [Saprolegnia diclina VS20]|eukprot:XP_008604954.1 hypothetical protein SDRG_01215 [Saprolegnia diclina VS20]